MNKQITKGTMRRGMRVFHGWAYLAADDGTLNIDGGENKVPSARLVLYVHSH